ncbi:hypothetical protein FLM48_00865 [Shewanella sp. Scap07]|uniref:hypothetical protein n=1 Tax=Shewanella sp. Scap07 TaxID=2589987 RepID=UPI0015BD0434|nr:hypothetical protein [Shewanella sp. Scap07]QLE83766.1 hypothetical protein FLM48_00865 [Shewanella sp. Scap07]
MVKWILALVLIVNVIVAGWGYVQWQSLQSQDQQLQQQLDSLSSQIADSGSIIPRHSVGYFNLSACPQGWQPFSAGAGRFTIATNHGDNELAAHNIGQTGGAEKHKLTTSEMPRHTHVYYDWYFLDMGNEPEFSTGEGDDIGMRKNKARRSEPSGESVPHNNMPPYIALTQCIKT